MALGTIGLSTYRWNNSWKSLLLIALYPAVTFWLFWWQMYFSVVVLAGRYAAFNHEVFSARTDDIVYGWGGLIFGTALLAWLIFSWGYHASIIRGLCLSHPVTAQDEPHLYAMLESVAISQGLPTPDLEIIETHARNCFVCDDGDTSRIFVTRGLLESLSNDEIEAVLAHEVAHILNGDNRLLSFSIAFCDLYPFISNSVRKRRMNEPLLREPSIREEDWGLVILLFVFLTPLWAGYFVTSLLRVFLFMNRELDADAAGVQITKNPDAMMRALIRINRRARLPFANHDIKFLCIDNPAGGFFATHPRLSTRLNNLREITNHPIPEIEPAEAAPMHKRFQTSPLLKRVFKKQKDPEAVKPFNAPWKS
jgi:heat shock protein HtpX